MPIDVSVVAFVGVEMEKVWGLRGSNGPFRVKRIPEDALLLGENVSARREQRRLWAASIARCSVLLLVDFRMLYISTVRWID